MASLVGSRVERKEDKRFLTGKGRYTADINLANQTYAYFVRSPHARAKINKIDTSKALKASGVVDILTGEHIAKDKIGGLIAGWAIRSEDGSEMKCPANPPPTSGATTLNLCSGATPPNADIINRDKCGF